MDPHLLRTFVCVAELGSFSAAAQRLGYTQSAVSQHIAVLESDLGTPVLQRRPVAPTLAGQRLLEHAAPILLRLAAARADVARAVAPQPAMHLGVTSLALVPGLAALLPAMAELTCAPRDEVVAGVAAGRFSAGLVAGLAAPSDPLRLNDFGPLHRFPVGQAEQVVVVALALDHPLAGRSGLALADLSGAFWIDAPGAAVPLSDLWPMPARVSTRLHGDDVLTLLALVAAGHGLALLPQHLAGTAGVGCVPITEPRLVFRVEAVATSDTDPLLELLRQRTVVPDRGGL
ncbi:LysR family transcriptional regulator [Rhizocola hellebori]|uniref:LysR family transcriptional regulator n=1 Tax=Rhizocola hellebori TaxID=1392758 RepID=UPI001942AABD|nr:LysR family transcriptional regulator [Rhizocola hellebori]